MYILGHQPVCIYLSVVSPKQKASQLCHLSFAQSPYIRRQRQTRLAEAIIRFIVKASPVRVTTSYIFTIATSYIHTCIYKILCQPVFFMASSADRIPTQQRTDNVSPPKSDKKQAIV